MLAAQENPKIIPSLMPEGNEQPKGVESAVKEPLKKPNLETTTEQQPTHDPRPTPSVRPAPRSLSPVEQEKPETNTAEQVPVPRARPRRPLSGVTVATNGDNNNINADNNTETKPIPPQRTKTKPALPPREDLEANALTKANEMPVNIDNPPITTSTDVPAQLKSQTPRIPRPTEPSVVLGLKEAAVCKTDAISDVVEGKMPGGTQLNCVENGEQGYQPADVEPRFQSKKAAPPIPPRVDLT